MWQSRKVEKERGGRYLTKLDKAIENKKEVENRPTNLVKLIITVLDLFYVDTAVKQHFFT